MYSIVWNNTYERNGRMKKRITIRLLSVIVITMLFVLFYPSQGDIRSVAIGNTDSLIYDSNEMQGAITEVKKYFKASFRDCILLEINYVGDDTNESVPYHSFKSGNDVDKLIIFDIVFNVGNNNSAHPGFPSDSIQDHFHIITGWDKENGWRVISSGKG